MKEVKKWKKSKYVLSLENGNQYSIEGLRKIFYRIGDELGIDSNPNAVRLCMADWYDRNTNLSDEEIARQIGNEPQTLRRHYKKRKLKTVKATVRKLNGNNSNSS